MPGDGVIVETARGAEFGDVSPAPPPRCQDEQVVQPLKPVLRVATAADRAMRDESAAREARGLCRLPARRSPSTSLDMKLVDVEYTFNGGKVIFYFTADERVDFRELVKDLAGALPDAHRAPADRRARRGAHARRARLVRAGPCAARRSWTTSAPSPSSMAKEQNLSLSPTKISGLCGRLMCCLQYEQAAYEEMKKLMPKAGKEIQTPDGNGVAVENNAITERTKVKLTLPDGTFDLRWYHYTELAKVGDPPPKPRETPAPADGEALSAPRPAAPRKPRSRKSAPRGLRRTGRPAGRAAGRGRRGRATAQAVAFAAQAGRRPGRPARRQGAGGSGHGRDGQAPAPSAPQAGRRAGAGRRGRRARRAGAADRRRGRPRHQTAPQAARRRRTQPAQTGGRRAERRVTAPREPHDKTKSPAFCCRAA